MWCVARRGEEPVVVDDELAERIKARDVVWELHYGAVLNVEVRERGECLDVVWNRLEHLILHPEGRERVDAADLQRHLRFRVWRLGLRFED